MVLLRRNIASWISISINSHIRVHSHQVAVAELMHTITEPESKEVVSAVCDSLRRGCNWDNLTRRFDSVGLSGSIVEKVLLELKDPTDATRALSFFHWSAHRKNFEHGVQTYCITIQILIRARLLADARALLEAVLKKTDEHCTRFAVVDSMLSSCKATFSDPFLFDLLIQTYSKLRMFEVAFDVCCYLTKHGFSLSVISFNTLIHVVQKSNQNVLVWKIYEHMIQKRTYPNEETIRIMIGALCKEGKLQKFVDILDRIHGKRCTPMVIVNTSLIFLMIEEGRPEEGIMLLKRMLQKNMILDITAFSLIVHAKVRIGDLDSAWAVHEEMLRRGFQANAFVLTSFIGAYCQAGRMEEADFLMQEMERMGLKPYNDTYNFLIEGCCKAGRLEGSLSFCEKMMARRLVPSCSVFNEMVGRLCETGNVKQANSMLTLMLDKGFSPDTITYSHLIAGYGKENGIQEVLKLYHEMKYRSLAPGLMVYTSLISTLCQCRKLEKAEYYLRILKDQKTALSPCVYEMLIACNFEMGNKTRALQLFNEMISQGLKPSCSRFCGANVESLRG